MTGRHHRPPRLTVRRVAIADGGLLALSLTIALAATWAPDARAPHAAALPTAVEKVREPSGHGGLGGPVAGPTFPSMPVWTEDKGRVTYGKALPQSKPTANSNAAAEADSSRSNSASTPESTPGLPVVDAEPQPAAQPADSGLLALVNADRAEAGCGPVAIADDLTSQAQTHSNGQAAADQWFHSAGVSGYDTWGENVAVGPETESQVHADWMQSPGHRENVLNCRFTLIGWASADGASGRYWTEMFAA